MPFRNPLPAERPRAFTCQHCGNETRSRFQSGWLRLEIGAACDDDTGGGDVVYVCSTGCAEEALSLWTIS